MSLIFCVCVSDSALCLSLSLSLSLCAVYLRLCVESLCRAGWVHTGQSVACPVLAWPWPGQAGPGQAGPGLAGPGLAGLEAAAAAA